jgi:outer membrane scaffolding protein for murein synthesis (MipA/OmpV family)
MPSAFAAGETDVADPAYPGWGIGSGAAVQSRPYKDIGNKTSVLPVLSFENRWVRIGGLGADLKLGSAGPVSFALGARYSLSGYEADDAPILNGMAERKGGLWIGPSATWRTGYADIAAEALGDASGNSKGAQFRLTVDRSFQSGAFRFTPRVAAIWHDKKYNDYYYGVRAEEARIGRPFYEGRASTDMEIGLRTNYSLTRQHSLFLDVSATRYGKGVKDSPLVDTSSSAGVRMGYLYRF